MGERIGGEAHLLLQHEESSSDFRIHVINGCGSVCACNPNVVVGDGDRQVTGACSLPAYLKYQLQVEGRNLPQKK